MTTFYAINESTGQAGQIDGHGHGGIARANAEAALPDGWQIVCTEAEFDFNQTMEAAQDAIPMNHLPRRGDVPRLSKQARRVQAKYKPTANQIAHTGIVWSVPVLMLFAIVTVVLFIATRTDWGLFWGCLFNTISVSFC